MHRRDFLKSVAVLSGGLLLRRQAAANRFLIPPTVQHVTETTATIYWRLEYPTEAGLLRVNWAGVPVAELPFSGDRAMLTVEGLGPGTRYTYEVLADGRRPTIYGPDFGWGPLGFQTQPFTWPLRIAAVGDSGFGEDVTVQLGALMAAQQPDLFLHLGDIVYRSHEYNNDIFFNWNLKYFRPFAPLLAQMPHYATPGNHDQEPSARLDGEYAYYTIYPPLDDDETRRDWFSVDVNGIQFISLNSQLFYISREERDRQNAWLDAQLARPDVQYRVVLTHIPPYNSGDVHQWDGQPLVEQWVPRFQEAGVKLVLSGHAHLYERLHREGIHYIVAGNGSHSLYGRGERLRGSEVFHSRTGFALLDLYEDRVDVTALSVEGDVMDQAELPLA